MANFHPLYFDDTTFGNSQFDHGIPNLSTTTYSTLGGQIDQRNETDPYRFVQSPLNGPRLRPISRIGFVVPGTPQCRPPTAFGKSPSGQSETAQGCRYLVLGPLLQHINGIIPASIACDLIDFYFAEPSRSLFESASPYVLTHIFRKKSFLHPTNPRITSPALLAAMLWVTAQTSDSQIFKTSPMSRGRICDRLFAICLRLLNPLLHESPRTVPERIAAPERSHNGTVRDGIQSTGTLDDVLTLTLIGIVVSGGDFKHDCLKWWRAAWALAKELGLGEEVDTFPNGIGNADSPYGSTQASGQNGSIYNGGGSSMTEEEKEERRRTWWLLYIANRHLALSFNSPLTILDAECHLYQPLDDASWQDFDPDVLKARYYGPVTIFTGVGLFEYFLPLMVILGDLIDIHHRSYHPRFKNLENAAAVAQVESLLQAYEQSLKLSMMSSSTHLQPQFQSAAFTDMQPNFDVLETRRASVETLAESRLKIVIAYATHILHVLHILLYGSWDPISMLDNLDNWTASPSFVKCDSHSVSAANALDQILKLDPELSFMPYLFGIYLLHGSFVLLSCADKVQIEEHTTMRQACETTIRAHEVCVATLNTEYQLSNMAFLLELLAGICLATFVAARIPATTQRDISIYTPKYRISPIDGSTIALPTPEQLAFQDKEIGVLIHFEIATYISNDGCNNVPTLVPNQTIFDPTLLNTNQWMDTITSLGAKYATLVAKHNCGFATWPSDVIFQTTDNETIHYNYTIAQSPVSGQNVVKSFVDSAEKYNVGHGFYYSLVWNNFLNVQDSKVRNATLSPGQVGITDSTYDQIVQDQLTDLWSNYGNLTELDGGYSTRQMGAIESLLKTHQPQAVVFNGCESNGTCISPNSVRWIGTETGQAPKENWSSGVTKGGGDPHSPYFCPAECDTTLQTGDRWFFRVNQPLRSLKEMIDVYHKTVGRNCLLELDLAPDRSGLVPAGQVARYKQLGDFINSCYSSPIAHNATHSESDTGIYSMKFDQPTLIDRIILMEDQTDGQVIRSYQVYGKISNDTNGASNVPFTLISKGTSVGHKKIDLFSNAIPVIEVMVNSTYVDIPVWRSVSVHLCDSLPSSTSAYSIIQAESSNSNNGTRTQQTSDVGGGKNVGWFHNGNWIGYYNVDFGSTGARGLVARIASNARNPMGGSVLITLDSPTAAPIGKFSVSNIGRPQT
ncbi:hypothetical protein VE04_07443 [Pseudogymnoascus sp. 24MN13]|nr:hypothetical protein VE04_07443 [Pseudogymnoascus sp. 24MN13]